MFVSQCKNIKTEQCNLEIGGFRSVDVEHALSLSHQFGVQIQTFFLTAFLPWLVWEVCLLKERQSGHSATLVLTCACLRCLWRPANSGGLLFLQIIRKSYAEKTWRKKVRLFVKARPCNR